MARLFMKSSGQSLQRYGRSFVPDEFAFAVQAESRVETMSSDSVEKVTIRYDFTYNVNHLNLAPKGFKVIYLGLTRV